MFQLNVNLAPENSRKPLRRAAFKGHEAVEKLLLARDNIDERIEGEGIILYFAVKRRYEAEVRILLKKRVVVDVRDKKDQTALYSAAIIKHEAVIKLLLENGLEIKAVDKNR
jgi:ankyrin repeat protein